MENKVIRCYGIGNVIIGYEGPDFEEKDYLSKFRVAQQSSDIYYKIILKEEITVPEIPCVHRGQYSDIFQNESEYIRIICGWDKSQPIIKDICQDNHNHLVEFHKEWERKLGSSLLLKLFDIPYLLLSREAVFLHASYVLWKGKAILFTAPKQTGKSTQAVLWKKYRDAKIINGDRALLRKKDDCWMVYGSPYCGTSRICENIESPLGAIVILSQAKQNKVFLAKAMESFISLMDGCSFRTWNKKDVETVTDLAKDLVSSIPFYKLECLPNEDAVTTLEEVLW